VREDELKRKIVDRMSSVENHLIARAGQGLLDSAGSLEVLYREILNATHGWNLEAANWPKRNFPAIDLHDLANKIAVQVTIQCDTTKILKTQNMFAEHALDKRYDRLLFVAAKLPKTCSKLRGSSELFPRAKALNLDGLSLGELELLFSRISASLPEASDHEISDFDAFEVVVGVLERPAIQHKTFMEGNFDDMLRALDEISQLLNGGEIAAKPSFRAKSKVAYSEPYATVIRSIATHIGRMSALVKKNLNDCYFLPYDVAEQVDRVREDLVDMVNAFCAEHGHRGKIEIWAG
jgi:hypothetical protein